MNDKLKGLGRFTSAVMIAAAMAIMMAGCSSEETVTVTKTDAEAFAAVAEGLSLETEDATEAAQEDGQAIDAYVAAHASTEDMEKNDDGKYDVDYIVEFCDFESEDYAAEYYETVSSAISETYAESDGQTDETEKTAGNLYYHSAEFDEQYYVVVKVDDTLIYAYGRSSGKDTVDTLIKGVGYAG